MKRFFLFPTLAISLVLAITASARAANVEVRMQNTAFTPNPVRVNVGDTVTWVNLDFFQHTTTSGTSSAPDGKWASPFLDQGQTFAHTFDTAGSYPYYCIPHAPFMSASVIVEAPQLGPSVAITSPVNNAVLEVGPVHITAEASVQGGTIAMVEFFNGNTFLGMDHDQPFSTQVNLVAGSHTLTAKATANTGASVTSEPVNVTVNATPAPVPTVTITAPANNSSFPGPTNLAITTEATFTGGTITKVDFFNGTANLGSATGPFTISPSLVPGSYTLTAVATTSAGSTATSSVVNVTITSGGTRITDPIPQALAKGDTTIELQLIADGLVSPLGLAAPDDNSNRLFLFDQVGVIYVITNGTRLETPLLDLRSRIFPLAPNYDERGLLGVATHPNFAQNAFIYTHTSELKGPTADFPITDGANDHQSVIAEWKIDPENPNRVDPASRREILRIDQPQANHNGGAIHFGPDGMFYIAIGDGGSADDQGPGHSSGGNGQDLNKILGKVARINVEERTSPNGQYGVPSDNPFVGKDGVDEIYAVGFRNPYSWSFDKRTGEMYVADVGQNDIEELDRVFKGGNYGWPIKEGSFYFDPAGAGNGFVTTAPVRDVPSDLVDPIAEYDHGEGITIVGGYVYHGTKLPNLIGRYVTGDLGRFESARGRLLYLDRSEFKDLRIGNNDRALDGYIKGFGQDQEGELYVLVSTNIGPSGSNGRLLKIVAPTNDLTLEITQSSTDFVLGWSGGVGPFLLQEKESVEEENWTTVTTTASRSATAPNDDPLSVFRVADMAGNGPIPFTVYMTGAAERPTPITTDGIGTGTLSLEGNTLHFDIRYSGLSGPATAAHIHGRTNAASAAGVMINLAPYNGGAFGINGVLAGSVTLTPEQKAAVLAGETYVNVHTGLNPGGEIRGQIIPVLFTAELTGEAEQPEVDTTGAGSGTFMLVGNKLTFDLEYHDLSTNAFLAHIHGPATEDETGNVMVDLAPLNGGTFSTNGTIGGTVTLTPDQLAEVVDTKTYVNIHTPLHGGGEIRGQLRANTGAVPLTASLSGAAERPTSLTNVTGIGSGSFALEGNRLSFNIRYSGLTGAAIAAHIHGPASANEFTGVMVNLAPFNGGVFGTNGTLSGSVLLTDEQRAALLESRAYVNIHTPENQGGEIRGQVLPVAMQASLSGASERASSVQTSGRGRGTLLLVGNQLTLGATYSKLSTTATAAHIHGPASTADATGVMVNLQDLTGGAFDVNGSFHGTVPLTPAQIAALADRLTYLNVHTGTHPGGEIRGQITR